MLISLFSLFCFVLVFWCQIFTSTATFDIDGDTNNKTVDDSLKSFFELIAKENANKQKRCELKYSKKRFRCCEGRAHFIPSRGISYLCCRHKAYVPNSHICCGDEVQRKVVTGHRTGIKKCCAGKNPYEPGKELCCNKEVVNSEKHGCCRNSIYDRAFATCCSGRVVPILSTNPDAEIGCCGEEAYDMSEKMCCAGVLRDFMGGPQNTRCCNDKAYDTRAMVCCNGLKLKQATGLTECCFGRMIDPTKNICCNYGIKELEHGKNTGCCRFDNYRRGLRDYFEIYNMQTQICCGGKLAKRKHGESTSCCYQRAYNVDTHVCCKGRLFKKRKGRCGNYRCCGKRMYCNDTLICCAGKADNRYNERMYRKKDYSRCCGWKLYNRASQKCATGNKVEKLS